MDEQIGLLLNDLRERGQLDNTLLIVTSDHGEHLGDHDLMSHGNSFYRQLLQVPLIVRYPPRLPGDRSVRIPVSLRDVPATVLDVVGVPNRGRFPGVSILPLVGDSTATASPVVSGSSLVRGTEAQSLIDAALHYIRNADGTEELFDLEHDSLEERSLASTPAGEAVLPALRARLDSINASAAPVPR